MTPLDQARAILKAADEIGAFSLIKRGTQIALTKAEVDFLERARKLQVPIALALIEKHRALEECIGLLKRTEASLSALDKFGFTDATWHTAMENRDAARALLARQGATA